MPQYSALSRHNWKGFLANSLESLSGTKDPTLDAVMQRAQYTTSLNSGSLVNNLFGSVLYAWYNTEHKWLSALPQVDMTSLNFSAGDPIPKSFRAAHSPVSLDTHSEGGSVSSAANFTVEEVSFEVKRSETVISVSDLQQIESMIEDAVGFDELWQLQQEQLHLAVDSDAIADSVLEADSDYDSRDEITELDRAIASKDEEDNSDDTGDSSFTDGALDYGTIDRSADSWADSYVDHNGTSGNRQLTRDLMDDFLANLGDNGTGDPYEEGVIFTGRDSAKVLSDLMADSTRGSRITFDGDGAGRDTVNDADTLLGLAGTTRFRQYDGIPIVENQNAPSDGISRIFVLNLGMTNTPSGESVPRIAIENYAEPYVETAGRGQSQGYLALGNYEDKALFLLNHELVSRDNPSHGKLRDLSE